MVGPPRPPERLGSGTFVAPPVLCLTFRTGDRCIAWVCGYVARVESATARVRTGESTRRPRTDELQRLWKQYRVRPDDKRIRDRLILSLAPMVKFIVYRKVRNVPAHVEIEDYLSVGIEALILSLDRYDPTKGATLEQFAWTRVHGADRTTY